MSSCTSVLIESHDSHNIYFALKHFPGHGSTPIDSHYNLPDISSSHSEYDFMPYYELFNQKSDYQMVMIGHLMNDQFDEKYPASLSKKHISFLTDNLNYDGLIITDDLNMGALYKFSRNKTKIAKMALAAGNHLLLFEYLTAQQIIDINETLLNESKKDILLQNHLLSSYDLIDSTLVFDDQ